MVLDTIEALFGGFSNTSILRAELRRLFRWLKDKGVTAMITAERGERNRGLYVLKSRGMAHSNQVREFVMHSQGIELIDVYLGSGRVLTGSARLNQEAAQQARKIQEQQEQARRTRAYERRKALLEANIEAMRKEFEAETETLNQGMADASSREAADMTDRLALAQSRHADAIKPGAPVRSRSAKNLR